MRVGADIRSTCRKCGDVWHVVIAMSGGQIAKVECKDCNARHGYRPITAARAARTTSARRAPAKSKASIVEADLTRARRNFRASDTYAVGDRVLHPSFGEGVVQLVIGSNKVEVLFGSGSKTLVHGRSAR